MSTFLVSYDRAMKRIGGAAVAAMLVLGLAACTPSEGRPTASPTKSASPEPSATAKPTAPVSSYGFGCENLVPQDVVVTALAPAVTLEPSFADPSSANPLLWAANSLGGLHCTWSNGESRNQSEGGTPLGTERWAEITILPGSHADWDAYFERWANGVSGPWPDSTTLSCFTQNGSVLGVCSINFLVGDSWVDLIIYGPADNAAASDEDAVEAVTPFIEAIRAALEPVGTAPRYAWGGTTPGANALPTDCEAFVPAEAMSEALGQELAYSWAPKKRLWNRGVAADDFGAPDCIFSLPDSDSARGVLRALPGGRWAYEQLLESRMTAGTDIEIVTIDGLGARDAFLECSTSPWATCSLQLAVAGHWLQVQVDNESSLDGIYGVDELGQQALAYAELAAASITARP
ncbi:DUF3558 domain-containing protein [Plantibacter sp. RU18]